MTVTVSMLWIIGMAITTVAILTVSTLAAAGMLRRSDADARVDQPPAEESAVAARSISHDRAA